MQRERCGRGGFQGGASVCRASLGIILLLTPLAPAWPHYNDKKASLPPRSNLPTPLQGTQKRGSGGVYEATMDGGCFWR